MSEIIQECKREAYMPIIMTGKKFQATSGPTPGTETFFDGFESGTLDNFSGTSSSASLVNNTTMNGNWYLSVGGTSSANDWLSAGDDLQDQKISIKMDGGGSWGIAVAVRYIDNDNYYGVRWGGNDDLFFYKVVGGVATQLSVDGSPNDVFRGTLILEVSGFDLTAELRSFDNTTQIYRSGAVSDSGQELSSGKIAIGGQFPGSVGTARTKLDDVRQVAL